MSWQELWDACRRGDDDRVGINSPVTVVEGRGGNCNPCGPQINLEQYTDFVLNKFVQMQEQGWNSGQQDTSGPMKFSMVYADADQPQKSIGFTSTDSMGILTYGLVCRVPDAGATTLTITITYWDPVSGSTVVTDTISLTSTGVVSGTPTPIFMLGGSTVTVSVALTAGTYGVAKFDAFVGIEKVG